MILDPNQADQIIRAGQADLRSLRVSSCAIRIGRSGGTRVAKISSGRCSMTGPKRNEIRSARFRSVSVVEISG